MNYMRTEELRFVQPKRYPTKWIPEGHRDDAFVIDQTEYTYMTWEPLSLDVADQWTSFITLIPSRGIPWRHIGMMIRERCRDNALIYFKPQHQELLLFWSLQHTVISTHAWPTEDALLGNNLNRTDFEIFEVKNHPEQLMICRLHHTVVCNHAWTTGDNVVVNDW